MSIPTFYNAHHSPVGAFASFTIGMKGKNGGFGLGLSGPAKQNVFIGLETTPNNFKLLPFCDAPSESTEINDFGIEDSSEDSYRPSFYTDEEISRSMGACCDKFTAPNLVFEIFTPHVNDDLEDAYIPAICMTLTVTNSHQEKKRWIFGFEQNHPQLALRPEGQILQNGLEFALATNDETVKCGVGFEPGGILNPRSEVNTLHLLGDAGVFYGELEPGETKTIQFVAAWYKGGEATSGLSTRYAYTDTYESVKAVAESALAQFEASVKASRTYDENLASKNLSAERHFQLALAIRSYYGSTQDLIETLTGNELWIVNEGEYRMMNTLDLTADMVFFELDHHPWTVANVLEWFRDRYRYNDEIVKDGVTVEGGVAFTHDMGVTNQFSRPEYSSYERAAYDDCFSYMTAEELLNWTGIACIYSLKQDIEWAADNHALLVECLTSIERRDHPEATERKGYIQWDSSRCEGGAEITTYDSLDMSLGQTRGSGYMAGKIFGICIALAEVLHKLGDQENADRASDQAQICANAIISKVNSEGIIPAVFEENSSKSTIIPHVEGLIWASEAGLSEVITTNYADLLKVLSKHLEAVLKPGICLFPDGGWKLSSTSDNSWLSKVYLCQYIAESMLGQSEQSSAEKAHVKWLTNEKSQFYSWSDQIINGIAIGSKYYPRGVTAHLWTK
jgi:xylan 1,4-beta-xylosidase